MIQIPNQFFSSLLIDFFNSAKKSTMCSGDVKPISSIVVSTNFVPNRDMRYLLLHLVYIHVCLLNLVMVFVLDICLDVCSLSSRTLRLASARVST